MYIFLALGEGKSLFPFKRKFSTQKKAEGQITFFDQFQCFVTRQRNCQRSSLNHHCPFF